MLYPVEKLLEDRGKPLCARHDETVKDVLIKMVENDYSQLPVIDSDGNLTGMISDQTITRAYYHLGEEISLIDLTVDHCQEQATSIPIESDLFEALDRLKTVYAVVIVDGREPIGILTDYDTTHFFRDLYDGLIIVEDIEVTLRQLTETVFSEEGKLIRALINAFGRNNEDPTLPARQQDALSFFQLIQFITTNKNWPEFEPILKPKHVFLRLMHQVREIRNQLAHFRGRPDTIQSDVLKYARHWLATRPTVRSSIGKTVKAVKVTTSLAQTKGKYGPLQDWLTEQAKKIGIGYDIRVSFPEIEKLINDQLPPSAYEHRSWWGNKTVASASQSIAWLRAGWKVESVDFADESVVFRRTDTVLYQLFFLDVLNELKELRRGLTEATHTYPQNFWSFGAGKSGFLFSWTFTQDSRLRVSLEIDMQDKQKNQQAFALLEGHKAEIESELGMKLEWELLPQNRYSRMSASIPARINDSPEKLQKAKAWCLDTTLKFADSFKPRIRELKSE